MGCDTVHGARERVVAHETKQGERALYGGGEGGCWPNDRERTRGMREDGEDGVGRVA